MGDTNLQIYCEETRVSCLLQGTELNYLNKKKNKPKQTHQIL